jgi:hypothetical protein
MFFLINIIYYGKIRFFMSIVKKMLFFYIEC